MQNATPPSKLPKVRNDLGQFVACGRVIEREGRTLMGPPHTPPPKDKVFIIVTIFFYFAIGLFLYRWRGLPLRTGHVLAPRPVGGRAAQN